MEKTYSLFLQKYIVTLMMSFYWQFFWMTRNYSSQLHFSWFLFEGRMGWSRQNWTKSTVCWVSTWSIFRTEQSDIPPQATVTFTFIISTRCVVLQGWHSLLAAHFIPHCSRVPVPQSRRFTSGHLRPHPRGYFRFVSRGQYCLVCGSEASFACIYDA